MPVLGNKTFDVEKLLPHVNNYHRNSLPDEPQPATPQYNLAILEDMNLLDNLAVVHTALAAASGPLVDALLLLKVRSCYFRYCSPSIHRHGYRYAIPRNSPTVSPASTLRCWWCIYCKSAGLEHT